jgi:hypothetical protein
MLGPTNTPLHIGGLFSDIFFSFSSPSYPVLILQYPSRPGSYSCFGCGLGDLQTCHHALPCQAVAARKRNRPR